MKNEKTPKLDCVEKMKKLMNMHERIVRIEADAKARATTKALEEYFAEKEKDIQ